MLANTLAEYFTKGGPIMYPIALVAIILFAVVAERGIFGSSWGGAVTWPNWKALWGRWKTAISRRLWPRLGDPTTRWCA